MNRDLEQDQTLVIISQHYFPETTATAQLVTDLVSGLINRGRHVHVITASSRHGCSDPNISRLAPSVTLKRNIISKLLIGLTFAIYALRQLSRFHGSQNKVLIVSNPPFIVLIGPLLKILYQLQYAYLYQDLFPRSAILSGLLPSKGLFTHILTRILQASYSHASQVILLSNDMKLRYLRDNGDHPSLSVIPNWSVHPFENQTKSPNPLLLEYGISDKFVIQYSGNFGRLHDFLTILEAARILQTQSSIHFLFIGAGPKKNQILRYAENTNMSNISVMQFVPRNQLSISLDACDASLISLIPGAESCVAPSKLYGILASAKPVLLISRSQSLLTQELTYHNLCLASEPGDPIALAHNICKLHCSTELRATMSKNSLQYYKQKLGREHSLSLYETLLFNDRYNLGIYPSS